MPLVFYFLGLTVSALHCSTYQCQGQSSEVCGEYNAATDSFLLQQCGAGEYCPIPNQSNYSSCTVPEETTGFAWVGEVCNTTIACVGQGGCQQGRCTSPIPYDECTANFDCGVAQYCSPEGVCSDLQPIDSACYTDYQCQQNSGCNVTFTQSTGRCVPYLSLPPGAPVASCDTGSNLLCSSGTCYLSGSGGYCMSLVGAAEALPTVCAAADEQCVSEEDSVTGETLTRLCECGFTSTGAAYCPAFPGDPVGLTYLSQLQAWVNSTAIFNCSSQRRFNDYCMYSNWDAGSRLKYLTAYLMYSMYPLLQGNSDCVKGTFTRDYWVAEAAYENYLNQTHPDLSLWVVLPLLSLLQSVF